jgi:shikimate kinase
MGSGKTTVGRLVAGIEGAPFRDLDAMIENQVGMPVSEIFRVHGEPYFRERETELLPSALSPGAVASLGGGAVIADANWELVRAMATTVFLSAPFEVLWERLGEGAGRPLLKGGRQASEELYQRRLERYRLAQHTADATRPAEEIAAEVARLWR